MAGDHSKALRATIKKQHAATFVEQAEKDRQAAKVADLEATVAKAVNRALVKQGHAKPSLASKLTGNVPAKNEKLGGLAGKLANKPAPATDPKPFEGHEERLAASRERQAKEAAVEAKAAKPARKPGDFASRLTGNTGKPRGLADRLKGGDK